MKKRLNVNWYYVTLGIACAAFFAPEIYLAIRILTK